MGGCIGSSSGVPHIGCDTAAWRDGGAGMPLIAASSPRAAASRLCVLMARFRAASPQALHSFPALRHFGDSVVPQVAQRRSPSSRRGSRRVGAGKPAGEALGPRWKCRGRRCSTVAAELPALKLYGSCVLGEVSEGIQHECCTPKVVGGVLEDAPPLPYVGSSPHIWNPVRASACSPRGWSAGFEIGRQPTHRTSDGAANGASDWDPPPPQPHPLIKSRPIPEAQPPLSSLLPPTPPRLPPAPPPTARTGIWR
jgi:hypothetical protein